jgi:hypothetical protein
MRVVERSPHTARQQLASQAPSFARAILGFVGSLVVTTLVLVVLAAQGP